MYYSNTDHLALRTQLNHELSIAVNWFTGAHGVMTNFNKFRLMVLGNDHDFSPAVNG